MVSKQVLWLDVYLLMVLISLIYIYVKFHFVPHREHIFFQNKDNRLMLYEYWTPITNNNEKIETLNQLRTICTVLCQTCRKHSNQQLQGAD
jgi:hypothetical protein